ncbi:hypothetical protein RZS08_54585, partial [Arthrospira platensis SPKY1]|nr:hypothetical protein [Arthrospira platensis SPKY1]
RIQRVGHPGDFTALELGQRRWIGRHLLAGEPGLPRTQRGRQTVQRGLVHLVARALCMHDGLEVTGQQALPLTVGMDHTIRLHAAHDPGVLLFGRRDAVLPHFG